MADQNNAPELPDRIWAWSEDDDFLRAKPHGVMHGTEYVRADRAAPPPACQQDTVTVAEAQSALAAARAEIERLTKERDLSKELLRSCIQGNNVLRKKAQKAIAERDEARSMLADAERDMRQRAAELIPPGNLRQEVIALPLKHADREEGADD